MADALGSLIQQIVVAPAVDDGHFLGGNQIVDLACVDTGGIDHHFGKEISLGSVDQPAALHLLQTNHLGIEGKGCAVGGGIFRQGNIQTEGAHDGAAGGPESRHRIIADVGLHPNQLFPVDDPQFLDTVGNALFVELAKLGTVLFRHAQHQAAAAVIVEVQVFGQLLHKIAAPDVQLCHQASGLRIKAAVDNGGIGLAGAAADILFLFQNQDIGLIPAQLPGNGAAV